MRKGSFWRQYFKTLKRHKVIAAATFSLVAGSFGATAFQTPSAPEFYAEGVLVDNEPVVTVSETSLQINEQGKGIIDETLLLSDLSLEATARKLRDEGISFTSVQLVEKTRLAIDEVELTSTQSGIEANQNSEIASKVTIRVLDENPDVAETTLQAMMAAMIELSEATNKARLERLSEELTARVSEIESSIQADTAALQAAESESSRAVLEKQIERKEAALDEAIARLADAELAEPEIVSSLAIATPPFIANNDPEAPSTLFIMTSGISTAVLVVGWLIFGLSLRQKDDANNDPTENASQPTANNQPPQFF
ncbi:MAG: hypothetical protein AAFQ95_18135 [Cyanobacteria bacterium J06621_3]